MTLTMPLATPDPLLKNPNLRLPPLTLPPPGSCLTSRADSTPAWATWVITNKALTTLITSVSTDDTCIGSD